MPAIHVHVHSSTADRIEQKLDAFIAYAHAQGNKIMTALSDLQAAMAQLSSDVDVNTTDTAAAVQEITALLAQIAAGIQSGASDADLQALTSSAQTLVAKVEASNAALAGAIPPAPTP